MKFEKVLFLSDVHYNNRIFRGNDESRALDWLIETISHEKPDIILSAGDWDVGFRRVDDFLRITSKVPLITIYGNHENMEALLRAKNPLLFNRHILLDDCERIDFGEFTVTGVNGIISKKKSKKGVPRKSDKFFAQLPELCPSATFFLTHEVPSLKTFADRIRLTPYSRLVSEVFRHLDVDLILGGHLHIDCFTFYKNGEFTYLRVDSSQAHRCYALLYPRTREIIIKQDRKKADTFVF